MDFSSSFTCSSSTADDIGTGGKCFLESAFDALSKSCKEYESNTQVGQNLLRDTGRRLHAEMAEALSHVTSKNEGSVVEREGQHKSVLTPIVGNQITNSSSSVPPAPFECLDMYAIPPADAITDLKSSDKIQQLNSSTGNLGNLYENILYPPINGQQLPPGVAYEHLGNQTGQMSAPYVCIPPVIHVIHSWASNGNTSAFPCSVGVSPELQTTCAKIGTLSETKSAGETNMESTSPNNIWLDLPRDIEILRPPYVPFNNTFVAQNKEIATKWRKLKDLSATKTENLMLELLNADPRLACLVDDTKESNFSTASAGLRVFQENEMDWSSEEEICEDLKSADQKIDTKRMSRKGVDKLLANLLISWYFAGFYTGQKTAVQHCLDESSTGKK